MVRVGASVWFVSGENFERNSRGGMGDYVVC